MRLNQIKCNTCNRESKLFIKIPNLTCEYCNSDFVFVRLFEIDDSEIDMKFEHSYRKRFFMNFARNKPCQIRIARECGFEECDGEETTVNTHFTLKGYKAMGSKSASLPDICAAHGCRTCHGLVDGTIKPRNKMVSYDEIQRWHAEAVMRTLDLLVREGLLPNP